MFLYVTFLLITFSGQEWSQAINYLDLALLGNQVAELVPTTEEHEGFRIVATVPLFCSTSQQKLPQEYIKQPAHPFGLPPKAERKSCKGDF